MYVCMYVSVYRCMYLSLYKSTSDYFIFIKNAQQIAQNLSGLSCIFLDNYAQNLASK